MDEKGGWAQTPGMNNHPAQTQVFGVAFVEIINPGGGAVQLPGWHTRLWPVARLGDQTLEAWPVAQQLSAGQVNVRELLTGLRAAGITPLGVRLRPGHVAAETYPQIAPPLALSKSLPASP